MTAALRVEVAPEERDIARAAADWCQRFYPALQTEMRDTYVLLSSGEHEGLELSAIWSAAFLNESLAPAKTEFRRRVLDRLGQ